MTSIVNKSNLNTSPISDFFLHKHNIKRNQLETENENVIKTLLDEML